MLLFHLQTPYLCNQIKAPSEIPEFTRRRKFEFLGHHLICPMDEKSPVSMNPFPPFSKSFELWNVEDANYHYCFLCQRSAR